MNKIVLDGILSLGDNGIIYWYLTAIIGLTLIHCITIKFYNDKESKVKGFKNYLFILIFVNIIIIRLPGVSIPQLHLDEAEWMITAITFIENPIVWVETHLTNTRPLTVLPLITIGAIGLPIDYGTTRLVGILMNCALVYFIYKTLQNYFEDRLSIILCIPVISMLSLFTLWDYIAYNSEIPCILAIAISIYVLTKNLLTDKQVLVTGIIVGSIPHIKEQAVPTAVILFVLFLIKIKNSKSYLKFYLACIIFPNLIYFGTILYNDDLKGFWLRLNMMLSYSQNGLTEDINNPDAINKFTEVVKSIYSVIDTQAYFFMWTSVTIVLIFLNYRRRLLKTKDQITLIILLLIILYTIYKPVETYPHYILFLISPLFILMSYNLGIFLNNLKTSKYKYKIIYIYLLMCSIVPSMWLLRSGNIAFINSDVNENITKIKSREINEIMKYRREGDSLAMWGWENFVYIDAMLLQGIRLTFPSMILLNYPQKNEYLSLYEKDILENNVTFFMDSTGKGNFFGDREQFKHENFGNMKQIIKDNYVFLGDYNQRVFI